MNFQDAFFDELTKVGVDWSIVAPALAGAGLGGVGGYYGAKGLGAGGKGRAAGAALGALGGGALGAGGSLALQPEKAKALLSRFGGGDEGAALKASGRTSRIIPKRTAVSAPAKLAPVSAPPSEIMGPPAPSKPPAIRWKPSGSKDWKSYKPKTPPVKPLAGSGTPHMKWKPSGSKTWNVGENPVTLSKSEVDVFEAMKDPKNKKIMQEVAAARNADILASRQADPALW